MNNLFKKSLLATLVFTCFSATASAQILTSSGEDEVPIIPSDTLPTDPTPTGETKDWWEAPPPEIYFLRIAPAYVENLKAVTDNLRWLYNIEVIHTYQFLPIIKIKASPWNTVGSDPRVIQMSNNAHFQARATTQSNAPEHLDRLDQYRMPGNGSYSYNQTGEGVNVYVLDTRISTQLPEFGGRATNDYDFTKTLPYGSACLDHGTHVAGLIGSTTFGVAKKARIRGLNVMECPSATVTPYTTVENLLDAMEWLSQNISRPAVVEMAFSGDPNPMIDDVIKHMTMTRKIPMVAAAGVGLHATRTPNDKPDNAMITVGVVNHQAGSSIDELDRLHRFGPGVTLYAPGVNLPSLNELNQVKVMSGTSQASALAAGAVALILESSPNLTPYQVRQELLKRARPNVIMLKESWELDEVTNLSLDTGPVPSGLNMVLGTERLKALPFTRYRLAADSSKHYYTTSFTHMPHLYPWQSPEQFSFPWVEEGLAGWLAPNRIGDAKLLMSFYNRANGDHMYTTDHSELTTLWNLGYEREADMGWCFPYQIPGTQALYRYYRNDVRQHFWTTDVNELGGGAYGWTFEGISCWVYNSPD